jgi:thioester reductase-like protein
LISGCTGFLAKIILEKLIRTVSDFKKIYVLIRRKQGTTLQSRMQREIYDSQLFKILFEKQPELIALVKERVIPVQGDLIAEELGMDPKQRKIL